jgi:hypothetical protein
LRQPGGCGLEMLVGTRRVAVRLAGSLPLVRLGGESVAAPSACAGSVGGLRCVALLRDAYTGRLDCLRCVELLP